MSLLASTMIGVMSLAGMSSRSLSVRSVRRESNRQLVLAPTALSALITLQRLKCQILTLDRPQPALAPSRRVEMSMWLPVNMIMARALDRTPNRLSLARRERCESSKLLALALTNTQGPSL